VLKDRQFDYATLELAKDKALKEKKEKVTKEKPLTEEAKETRYATKV